MTKRLVGFALHKYREGRVDEAIDDLRQIPREFVRKRLTTLGEQRSIEPEDANILWRGVTAGGEAGLFATGWVPPPPQLSVDHPTVATQTSVSTDLDDPRPFLELLHSPYANVVALDELDYLQMWALVALATRAREGTPLPTTATWTAGTGPGRFAHSSGLRELIHNEPSPYPGEPRRTVTLRRINRFGEIEPTASTIAKLLLPDEADDNARNVVVYVLVELMRNVVQHSCDPQGGVVAAQLMPRASPVVQIAVGDGGVGVLTTLQAQHPEIRDAETALERSLQPHFSGTFETGSTGTNQNAGLGLFFISELAKLTGGRMLLASRGSSLFLTGDPSRPSEHKLMFLPSGAGFDGTLAVFEFPVASDRHNYDELIRSITEKAKERTPQRAINKWITYESPPATVSEFLVQVASEDTLEAEAFSSNHLQPKLFRQQPVALNFASVSICTQSYMHALLYNAIRIAWATRTRIYVTNCRPAVRSTIEFLEQYALGG